MALTDKDRERQLDAEWGVIGSLLIDPEIIRDLLAVVDEKDFLNPTNRLIFQTARALFRDGSPVDPITIRSRIGEQYTDYLVQVMEITPTAAVWQYYAEAMHEQATLQRIRDLAENLSQAVTLDDCRPLCAQLGQLLTDGRKLSAWGMREILDSFYESQDPEAPPPEYISCGLDVIDKGSYVELGDVVIIGGYPSDGKTALSIMMALHMAKTFRVGFFSLETSRKKYRDRLLSHAAQIDFSDIKRRTIRDSDWKRLAEQSGDLSSRDLTVIEAAGMTAAEIQSVSQAYGFQVIFIDYVQLVVPAKTAGATRSDQMAGVSRDLHTFAQRSGTLVVELAQLSRQEHGTSRDGTPKRREPDMHDLKESGQFEQDADMIFLLFRPGQKDTDFDPETHRFLKIVKNKESRRGKWPLYFDGDKQTFTIMADGSGTTVLRSLVDEGKKAKLRNRAEARKNGAPVSEQAETRQEIIELPAVEGNLPF